MSSWQAMVIERLAQPPGHVLDEARLPAAGGPFQHHRHAHGVGRLVQRDLVAGRAVVGLLGIRYWLMSSSAG